MECGRTIHADGSLRRRQLLRKRRGTLCSPDLYGMAWFHAIVGPNIARQPIAVSSEERLSQAAGGRRHFSAILKKPLQGAGWLYCGTAICRHHLCIQRLRQRVELVRCTNTVARGNPDPQALALIADRTWAEVSVPSLSITRKTSHTFSNLQTAPKPIRRHLPSGWISGI